MILTKAKEEQIPALVDISIAAFESDIAVGALKAGGPPEYNSIGWHIEMMNQGHLFAAMENDAVIGGAILFGDANNEAFMYVGRIFISPHLFRKGYGMQLMEQIERMNPKVTMWCLDTPVWNNRTNSFYKKIGYVEKNRDDEMVYYQKIIHG